MAELQDLPEALAEPERRNSISLVWIVPVVAALIGGWIAVHAILERGPTVTISFLTAEGLAPGKTRIRYKDVEIGEVKDLEISEDRSHIVVTAQFDKKAEKFLKTDTKFWVVRPRLTGGQISGVGTLLSGAYIGVGIGASDEDQRQFIGLETAPILTGDAPGKKLMLAANDLGSLDVGSPVYFRRIKVGEVIAHELDPKGTDVHVTVFIHAPYDQFVTAATRFWHASGVDVSMDATGMHVQTQSMLSLILGGIAFENAPNFEPAQPDVPRELRDSDYRLFADHALAMKPEEGEPTRFVLHFTESLRGLAPGAPVDFKGIVIGEVTSVGVEYQEQGQWFHFPVGISIYPKRMHTLIGGNRMPETGSQKAKDLLESMVEHGFRGQLRTGNLLTGQLYVAMDFFPDVPKTRINWEKQPLELPTTPGSIEELQMTLAKIGRKLDKVPFDEIGANLRTALVTLNGTVKSVDSLVKHLDHEVTPEAKASLEELRRTLASLDRALASDSPLQRGVQEALREATRAAQSFRSLTDTLERQPESLIRGKKAD
jgi:paraquat-inducible protein B